MSDQTFPSPARRATPWRPVGLLGLTAAFLGAAWAASPAPTPASAAPPSTEPAKEPTVGGVPLFKDWPANQKPEAVIVFSGQTWGHLQPCGCSRPQIGGLERRAVFIESLRAKGWPVAGVDLGDLFPDKVPITAQAKLKYKFVLHSLREMGYVAVGVGRTELANDLYGLMGEYALQKEQRPFTLAGNINGFVDGKVVPREKHFFVEGIMTRPMVDLTEFATVGAVPVSVTGVVGKSVTDQAVKDKLADRLDFSGVNNQGVKGTLDLAAKGLAAKKTQLNVLIYHGPLDDAEKVAKDFPQFHVILCHSDTDLPPMSPKQAAGPLHQKGQSTLIIQVGHKGQYVGVVGAFKNAGGGLELRYQLVPLTEFYITPGTEEQARKANKVLPLLEEYAAAVQTGQFLRDYPKHDHAAQIFAGQLKPPVKLTYVGSEACKACHAAEFDKWKGSNHAHALDTLEKVAKRPSLRHHDPDCVRCHTVGFHHTSGYVDAQKTPNLMHVGCESCHGPGSGHIAAPKDANLLKLMSPWKQPVADKLPDNAFMEKMAKLDPVERGKVAIPPAVQILMNSVSKTCIQCHDHENDPHFDLYKYWPKVEHSGLAPKK